MQAITTKYAGPTNSRGSRIIAKCAAGSNTVAYDYALNIDANHRAAALALVAKLGWTGDAFGNIATGCDHKGDYVHVFVV